MELKTTIEWKKWGHDDPFFGASSATRHKADNAEPWTPELFYAEGKAEWDTFNERWSRYGYHRGVFVEIGCGPGRLTKQLISVFEKGYATDVSPGMLERAKSQVSGDVTWLITDGQQLPVENCAVDAVFSCHVFQHLPTVEDGFHYFGEIFRVLKHGGSLMVHLPLYDFPIHTSVGFSKLCDWTYRKIVIPRLQIKWERARRRMKNGGEAPMTYISYDRHELFVALTTMGFTRIEFSIFAGSTPGSVHPCVMATKP